MRVPVEDMLFVLRGAGERTEGACEQLLRDLVARSGGNPEAQVVLVREKPFAKAVRRTFELGRDGGRAWVMAIDADVLLLGDAVERLGTICACADGAVFAVTPRVVCKFYGGVCCKGVHAYPARLMERALGMIESSGSEGDLRPEGAVVRAMAEKGYGVFGPPVVVGVHDYEQTFRHIYLKARLRARREAEARGTTGDGTMDPGADSLRFVTSGAETDADMLVASWGMEDGRKDAALGAEARTFYEWDGEYPEFEARMRSHRLREKGPWTGSGAGYAADVIGRYDFAADTRTARWVRERFDFAGDRSRVLARMGVAELPVGTERSDVVRAFAV